ILSYLGSVTINSNDSTNGTAVVGLSGMGAAPATVPQLTLSASSLAFGSVQDGTSKVLTLTLTSSGTGSLTVNSASLGGTGFSISGASWPQTLAPGSSYSMQVKF